jgi:hypothetical protein
VPCKRVSTLPIHEVGSGEARRGLEPIERWIFFAKHARATLNVAATLLIERGRDPERDIAILRAGLTPLQPSHVDWAQWWGWTGDPDDEDEDGWAAAKVFPISRADLTMPDPDLARAQEAALEMPLILSLALDEWLDLAAIHPTIDLKTGNPLVLAGDGLFGALALQLVFNATRTAGVAICANCGEPYSLDRAPAPAPRRRYCPKCRKNGAWKKFAMAKLRAKKRASATRPAESSVPADQ